MDYIKSFYRSPRWKKLRETALRRDKYLCRECYKYGKRVEAEVVHHKVEVLTDYSLAFDLDNLESLCKACHNKRHPEKANILNKPYIDREINKKRKELSKLKNIGV